MDNPRPLLTVPELSQWLRVQESTIRKWVCYNRIPYLKIGRCVGFRTDDIEAWLDRNNPHNEKWQAIKEAYAKKL